MNSWTVGAFKNVGRWNYVVAFRCIHLKIGLIFPNFLWVVFVMSFQDSWQQNDNKKSMTENYEMSWNADQFINICKPVAGRGHCLIYWDNYIVNV